MIKVYSTSTCPWCVKVKAYLKSKGIEFEDYNVQENETAAKEMIKISGQMGVPVLDINGNVIVGFDKAAIDSAIEK